MSKEKNDGNYYFLVIVLLVVMIGAMAALWVMEHNKLNRAVAVLNKQQSDKSTQDTKLREMIMTAEVEKNHMLDRDSFTKIKATLNGKAVEILVINRDDAVKAGLMDGDIVCVGEVPALATAATAKPAETPKTPENDNSKE